MFDLNKISELKLLIAEAEHNSFFKEFIETLDGTPFENDSIALSARYKKLKKSIINGTIDDKTKTLTLNKISQACLLLLDDIENFHISQNSDLSEKENNSSLKTEKNKNIVDALKKRLLLWGSQRNDEKLLIALELVYKKGIVKIYTFPESQVSEEFSLLMLNEWVRGEAVRFPEEHSLIDHKLRLNGRLLPDDIKVNREDVLERAQTEWYFIFLSNKLNESYQSELGNFAERIAKLDQFEASLWEELEAFWEKVRTQIEDGNLLSEHADNLKDDTDTLFEELTALRN